MGAIKCVDKRLDVFFSGALGGLHSVRGVVGGISLSWISRLDASHVPLSESSRASVTILFGLGIGAVFVIGLPEPKG